MNYSQLVKIFSNIALVGHLVEKTLSYYGQAMFPDIIYEGNPLARPFMNYFGIAMGHIIMFFIALFAILLLRWIGLNLPSLLKYNPRHREVTMAICVFALGYLALDGLRLVYCNVDVLWKVLSIYHSFY